MSIASIKIGEALILLLLLLMFNRGSEEGDDVMTGQDAEYSIQFVNGVYFIR
jgi:hypothetical protein